MKDKPEAENPKPLSSRQRKLLRETAASLLECSGNQRDYLVSVLLSQTVPETGDEPSLRSIRQIIVSFLEQLIPILRSYRDAALSPNLDFFRFINHFPLEPGSQEREALALACGGDEPNPEQINLFRRLELLHLLTQMGDFEAARPLFTELEPQVSNSPPGLRFIYQNSLAALYQYRARRLQFASLWLNLVSDLYQLDGADCALYAVLRWIGRMNWGRETALRKQLLLKFGPGLRHGGDLIAATLLSELFSLENKLAAPAEKMLYARLLFRLSPDLLTPRQLQNLNFFAGHYYSGMKLSFQQSIRYYQHSNYFLHKSWLQLQAVSRFLRENLPPEQLASALPHLEQQVSEMGSQLSLQNNAYVETLHANYDMIRELYRQVEELSITDNLTGLKNRRYLANNLYHLFQLAARHQVPVCFAMLDIDHFKRVNDQHGHLAGDKVLKDLAKLLVGNYRKSDVVIRYGGEEFLLIFFDIRREQFLSLMEDLRQRVESHKFNHRGQAIRITVSIGAACGNLPSITDEQFNAMLEKADAALYAAKGGGRNRVACAPDGNPA